MCEHTAYVSARGADQFDVCVHRYIDAMTLTQMFERNSRNNCAMFVVSEIASPVRVTNVNESSFQIIDNSSCK